MKRNVLAQGVLLAGLAAAPIVRAQAPSEMLGRVEIVRPPGAGAALEQVAARIAAELASLGVAVDDSDEARERAVADRAPVAVIVLGETHDRLLANVRLLSPETPRERTLDESLDEGSQTARVLAVRVVELLRAWARGAEVEAPAVEAAQKGPPAVGSVANDRPQSPPPLPVSVRAGIDVFGPMSPIACPSAAVAVRASTVTMVRAFLLAGCSRRSFDGPGGEAMVDVRTMAVELGAVWRRSSRAAPYMFAGGGVRRIGVEGAPALNYEGRARAFYAPVAVTSGGLAVRIARFVALSVELKAVVATRDVGVRVGSGQVHALPSWQLGLGAGLWAWF